VMLGAKRNGVGLRFSSTQAQGQKPVSPHVSSAWSLSIVPIPMSLIGSKEHG
jgi:hypothetical protein